MRKNEKKQTVIKILTTLPKHMTRMRHNHMWEKQQTQRPSN